MNEAADFFAELHVADQHVICVVNGANDPQRESRLAQFIARQHGVGANHLVIHETVERIAEFRRIMDTQKDDHARLRGMEHPVRNTFGFQLGVKSRRQAEQAAAIPGRERIPHLGIQRQASH